MDIEATVIEEMKPGAGAIRRALRLGGLFVLVGLVLYGALYAWSEALVRQYGERNRFFMVNTAPLASYDVAILGASHAMPFDFGDMNARLEKAASARIINLSLEGAGVLPNRLVLDYFLARHQTRTVLFFLDSFAFYSRQWNEDRINDANLFDRATFDPDLVATLLRYPWSWPVLPGYVSGFIKINNANRLAPDISEMEATKFTGTYRSIPQIDKERITYLYPVAIDPAVFAHYRAEFEDMVRLARAHGASFVVVKPPMPPRYRDHLPDEQQFDATMQALMKADDIPYYDLSASLPDDKFYEDTDHLNRDGVEASINGAFGDMLRKILGSTQGQ